MRFTGLLIGFIAGSLLLLPALPAQDKQKKDDPKEDPKKDTEKPEKPEKPVKKKEEKFEHGPVVKTKIISMRGDSAHEFTIEVPMPDPQQMYQLQMWQAQQMQQLMQIRNPQQYAQRMMQIQMQMAQKQAQGAGYTNKPIDVRAADNCKVRIMYPPVQYDDEGKLKKYTKKDLAKLKGTSKLPGYDADFDNLKVGQFVEVYLAKQHGSPKDKWSGSKAPRKKKGDDDPPPEPMPEMRPEVVLIVIHGEPMGR
jgi:hypothetical protein